MLPSQSDGIRCPICEAAAHIAYRSYPGYREPDRYDIARCFSCDTNFAAFDGADLSELYDQIYSQSDVVPGYDRYARYVSATVRAPDPLGFLAENELGFWGVRAALAREPKGARVLDIGSGLGYLTYALNRAGYSAHGLEISATVVAKAAERFGDFYTATDLFDYAERRQGTYDVVVLSEVIGHVPDVAAFVGACCSIVAPGGKLVVTTPNKSAYAPHFVWALSGPPVLLTWFSASSLVALSARCGVEVDFVDLSDFPGSGGWRLRSPREFVASPPILDAKGKLRPAIRDRRALLRRWRASLAKRVNRDDFARFVDDGARPPPMLCAVLRKSA
jgi:2-polyprenyl-3-methyl-5-hydroxy-6-metoxy-1,4-benzoquinol methylase